MSQTYYSMGKIAHDRQGDLLREAAASQMVKEARGDAPRANGMKRIAVRVGTPVFVGLVVLLLLGFVG